MAMTYKHSSASFRWNTVLLWRVANPTFIAHWQSSVQPPKSSRTASPNMLEKQALTASL